MIRLNGLTGGLLGSALVALGFAGSVVLAPPDMPPTDGTQLAVTSAPADPTPSDTSATMPDPAPDATPRPAPGTPNAELSPDTPRPAIPSEMPDTVADSLAAELSTAPSNPATPADDGTSANPDTALQAPAAKAPMTDSTTPASDSAATVTDMELPALPGPEPRTGPGTLPATPSAPRDTPLPRSPDAPAPRDTAAGTDAQPRQDTPGEEPALPGNRIAGMPGQPARPASPDPETKPAEPAAPLPALERNSSFSGPLSSAPLMTIVLNDPGLPTPLRRSLAALELPVTVALNPMDPSAPQAAEIYRAAGKEVLILANGLPGGAQITDLDVTFGAWFDSLPQAVGVLDLPRGGFARNANLTADVLPLVARDGHGLVSFAGGLSRVASAADRAGVPHAEVFRVLDDEDQSPFTIRRYLDRAVFQASQIGEVIVFGDATNDATMEALELWLRDGRADQVAVVPISAILMQKQP